MFSSNQDRSGRCNAFQGLCRAAISSPELFHFHVTSTNLSQHKFTTLKRPKSSGSGCDMTENIKSQNLSLRTTGGSLACCTKLAIASVVPNSYDLRRSAARRHNVFAISKTFLQQVRKGASWSNLGGDVLNDACNMATRLDSLNWCSAGTEVRRFL